ncbi:hypothetical protein SAMN04487944_10262 [Gracilibacillus ureilyticus]|uniref:Regulator of chromosome condensation (RCC1) repeat-containing protein n=1 Tax=Gracilibacillus ureilyticus TaxID=531814 RepID=A0A1H9MMK0_9BACI|nr:hypothetical protein [Gracilibacillus ureilyticus]SER24912.1 hypothetical protein SAMN04487944_10262 [Gracilibacillus ureilyticus]
MKWRKKLAAGATATMLATSLFVVNAESADAKTLLNPNQYVSALNDNVVGHAITESGELFYWTKSEGPANIGLDEIKDVANAAGYKIALTHDGEVFGWGSNQTGGLGPNVPVYESEQSQKFHSIALNNVASIDGYNDVTFAVKNDGTVWGWGRSDSYGRLAQSE